MSLDDLEDPLAAAAEAQQALKEANERRSFAIDAQVDLALKALVDGISVEDIMDACGFKSQPGEGEERELNAMEALMGASATMPTRKERFAQWLANGVVHKVMNRSDG